MSAYVQFPVALELAGQPEWPTGRATALRPCRLDRVARPVTLPPPAEPRMSLAEALDRRRSVRTYADEDVAPDALAAVLAAVLAAAGGSEGPLGHAVVCRRVRSVPAGSYHVEYRDGGHRIHRVGGDPPRDAWPQAEFATAPVVLVIFANLLQPGHPSPAGLYQRAGHAAYAASIAAERLRLGACMFYGPTLSARTDLRFDNVSRAPLAAVSIGAQEPSPSGSE